MSITPVPQKWRTTDEREFATEPAAQKHQALIDAHEAYEQASRTFGMLLAETQQTADGHAFSLNRWEYFYITCYAYQTPSLRSVSFSRWNLRYECERERAQILWRSDEGRWQSYDIGELYAYRGNAERALVTATERFLADQQADLETLRAKVEAGR